MSEETVLKNKELEKAYKLLEEAQAIANLGSWEFDFKTNKTLWSKQLYKIFGADPSKETTFDDYFKRLTPESKIQSQKMFEEVLKGKKEFTLESQIVRDDGQIRIIFERSFIEFDENNVPVRGYGTTQDITEQRNEQLESQKKLIQSSKMASLGEMAGGIAHEINNPLAIILGKISIIKKRISAGKLDPVELENHLNSIENTANRITKIVKGLKSFSRNSENDPMESISISQIINETLDLCKEKFNSHGVKIEINNFHDIYINCRSFQISQVLMNLLGNAFDAIENLPEKWVNINVTNNIGTVKIEVTDSGSGITDDVLAKLMQPFYTTKAVGKGTGLGLSISKGIIEIHNGKLYYDKSCKNTKFVIELPDARVIEQKSA